MGNAKTNIIEGSADILEYGIDFFTDNEVIKDFPVLGTIVKIGFTAKSISDKIFLKKIERFLISYQEISDVKKNELIIKIDLNKKERKKIGEALILLIDRISDLEKPYYIARCFSAYLNRRIDFENFMTLGNAIDLSHSLDLKQFLIDSENESNLDKLIRTGFAEISKNAIMMPQHGLSSVILNTKITDLGKVFLNVCQENL